MAATKPRDLTPAGTWVGTTLSNLWLCMTYAINTSPASLAPSADRPTTERYPPPHAGQLAYPHPVVNGSRTQPAPLPTRTMTAGCEPHVWCACSTAAVNQRRPTDRPLFSHLTTVTKRDEEAVRREGVLRIQVIKPIPSTPYGLYDILVYST